MQGGLNARRWRLKTESLADAAANIAMRRGVTPRELIFTFVFFVYVG